MLCDFYTFISTKVTNFNVSSDTMFEYGCTLPYQPSYLEIRRGHTILNQKLNEVSGKGIMATSKLSLWYFNYFSILEFVDGSELVSRCKDKTQAMMGMGDMLNITRTTV